MITDDGIVKILDFGLAKWPAPPVCRGRACASARPPICRPSRPAAEVDHRTDLWSLGVVLYEMLQGRHRSRRQRCRSSMPCSPTTSRSAPRAIPRCPRFSESSSRRRSNARPSAGSVDARDDQRPRGTRGRGPPSFRRRAGARRFTHRYGNIGGTAVEQGHARAHALRGTRAADLIAGVRRTASIVGREDPARRAPRRGGPPRAQASGS